MMPRTIFAALVLFASGCQPGPGSASPQGQARVIFTPTPAAVADAAPPKKKRRSTALGQVAPLGPIVSDPDALEDIVAGAIAGEEATLESPDLDVEPLARRIEAAASSLGGSLVAASPMMSARLTADAHAEGTFSMEPNICYVVVGASGARTTDFQLGVMTAPPMPPQVLAQSKPGGTNPVVGAGCLRSLYAVPLLVKIDLYLVKGEGMVAARVYRR